MGGSRSFIPFVFSLLLILVCLCIISNADGIIDAIETAGAVNTDHENTNINNPSSIISTGTITLPVTNTVNNTNNTDNGLLPKDKTLQTLQIQVDNTAIPLGFVGLPDSSNIFRIMYYLSKVPSTSIPSEDDELVEPEDNQGLTEYMIEAMVFRQADFATTLPTISRRVPIQKLSIQIQYQRPVSTQSRILSESLFDMASLTDLYNKEEVTVGRVPIAVGDNVQTSFVMKPISDYFFILPAFAIPSNIKEASVIFIAMLIPSSSDLTGYRQAIQRGATPASENPFFSTSIRVTSTTPATISTVTSLAVRTSQWSAMNLALAHEKSAYNIINFDFSNPQTSGIWHVLRNQTADLMQIQEVITTIPDLRNAGPFNDRENARQIRSADTYDYVVYSYNLMFQSLSSSGNIPTTGTSAAAARGEPLEIPSYYAPQQLLPLRTTNSDGTTEFSGLLSSSSNRRDSSLAQTRMLATASTLIAVAPPSGQVAPNPRQPGTNTQISAYPIQLRLLPFTALSSQFTIPHYTLAYWPSDRVERNWVDVQLQLQLVKLNMIEPPSIPIGNNTTATTTDPNAPSTLPPTPAPNTSTEPIPTTDTTTTPPSGNNNNNNIDDDEEDDDIVDPNMDDDDPLNPLDDDGAELSVEDEELDDGSGIINTMNIKNDDDSDDYDKKTNRAKAKQIKKSRQQKRKKQKQKQTFQQLKEITTLQRVNNRPQNARDAQVLVLSPMTHPDFISSDLEFDELGDLLTRFPSNTNITYHPDIGPTIRYNMERISNTNKRNWVNRNIDELYHFDYNLYALRANATRHNNEQEYAIVLYYQFITSIPDPDDDQREQIVFSDWMPFVTKLPTINQTKPSTTFPFDSILPNMNSVEFSTSTPLPTTATTSGPGGTTTTSTIIPVIPNNAPRRTTIQPIRVNERVDIETTEAIIGNPTLEQPQIRDTSTAGTVTTPVTTGVNNITEVPTASFNSTLTPSTGNNTTTRPNIPTTPTTTIPSTPGSTNNTTTPTPGSGNTNTTTPTTPSQPTTPISPQPARPIFNQPRAQSTYPVSPLYPTIGYNVTWFLLRHNPSSPYLFRHDVTPASLRSEELTSSLMYDLITNPQRNDLSNSLYVVDCIPSLALKYIAEVLDVKINIYINDIYQGTYNMKLIPGERIDFKSGVYNDVDGDGIRDSPALHNSDPQAYIRPFRGERWMSPVIQLHQDDLLGYSFTYQVKVFAKYIPEWADPRDEVYQTQIASTTIFAYSGSKSFVHAILPIESASPDPAELITAPIFKYSIKIRPAIPSSRLSLHFTIGRISSHDGGLLGLPPIDPGVCYATTQSLPLRGRHNVWMRMEFMPVSVLPLSPTAALRDSEGSLQSGFAATLPPGLKAADLGDISTTTTMSAIINYVLSQLPPLMEDWFYFDGLMDSTSSLLLQDDYHATFSSSVEELAPFPDPDPGLRLKATPSEELLLYAFTIFPQHNEQDLSTSSSLVYSPDTFTQTGRAIGFTQCYSLHNVCF